MITPTAIDLFGLPFCVGLAIALLLPLIGNLLRLRDEWLATLGYAHLAGAGALLGMALGWAPIAGAPLGALLGAFGKHLADGRGASFHGLLIIAGGAATLLVAANTTLGEALAHAVVDGQLYFTGSNELIAVLALLTLALPLLRWLTPRLIAARLFPDTERANRRPAWRWHLGCDLLAALAIAAAAATVGLLAAFALVFLPPWLAFRHAASWRQASVLAPAIGVLTHLAGFALALALDQPYGPLLAALLLGFFLCSTLIWRHHAAGTEEAAATAQRPD